MQGKVLLGVDISRPQIQEDIQSRQPEGSHQSPRKYGPESAGDQGNHSSPPEDSDEKVLLLFLTFSWKGREGKGNLNRPEILHKEAENPVLHR